MKYRIMKHFAWWRIKNGFGLDVIRTDRELDALIHFCKEELKNKSLMRLNPERKRIYEATIKLHKGVKVKNFKPVHHLTDYYDVHDFIGDHSGWYWN